MLMDLEVSGEESDKCLMTPFLTSADEGMEATYPNGIE